MKVKHLDHLNLSVSNFDQTVDWYKRVFGFTLVEEGVRGGVRWGIIKGGESMLCIYEHPEFEFPDYDSPKYRSHHISHFGLRITDRQEWEKTIQKENVSYSWSNGPFEYPHSTSWYVADPTGYEIEVALWHKDQISFDDAPLRVTAA